VGVAVLAGVAAIALGLDTGFLSRVSYASTASIEQKLLDGLQPAAVAAPQSSVVMNGGPAMMSANPAGGDNPAMMMKAKPTEPAVVTTGGAAMMAANPAMMMKAKPSAMEESLPVEGGAPSLSGAVEWLNTPPLTMEALKGKVVLVDFWTYVRAWADKYRDQGLVVIGVHAPEFAFEKNADNVKKAVSDLKIDYPVAIDNDYAIWRAFQNQYWPAHYFIDAQGRIRHHHFGEGDYDGSERVIQQLLAEAGKNAAAGLVSVNASGVEAASDTKDVQSPETYLGYVRAENFASNGGAVPDARHLYELQEPRLNEWGVSGDWTIGGESAVLNEKGGSIAYRFHARDLHLVLGPGPSNAPIRFRVTIDGKAPGEGHGADTDAEGLGVVTEQRLYQLVRQTGEVGDHTFKIEFLDPGVQAFAFTFG
jgi:hypothetical protein